MRAYGTVVQISGRGPDLHLLGLATAVPPNVIEQTVAAEMARGMFGGRMAGFDVLARVFTSAGIDRRYSVEPPAWFTEDHGWPDRTASYMRGAQLLFEAAVTKALAAAHLRAADVDAVITVSSTGVATPSLEARVLPRMGFRDDVRRTPVFGLGCAGGVTGMAIAARLAASEPGITVLLVAIELCTLSFRNDRLTKADIVSAALFGDGAAAAIMRCGDPQDSLARIGAGAEHLWPETLDIMGWSTDAQGLGVVLARSLPDFITKNYRAAFDRALERLHVERSDVDRIIAHPGGPRVLDAIETALDEPIGTLDIERSVMRDFGNMSSPTVLFVLERALAGGFRGRALLAALGPGFTASFLMLDASEA